MRAIASGVIVSSALRPSRVTSAGLEPGARGPAEIAGESAVPSDAPCY